MSRVPYSESRVSYSESGQEFISFRRKIIVFSSRVEGTLFSCAIIAQKLKQVMLTCARAK